MKLQDCCTPTLWVVISCACACNLHILFGLVVLRERGHITHLPGKINWCKIGPKAGCVCMIIHFRTRHHILRWYKCLIGICACINASAQRCYDSPATGCYLIYLHVPVQTCIIRNRDIVTTPWPVLGRGNPVSFSALGTLTSSFSIGSATKCVTSIIIRWDILGCWISSGNCSYFTFLCCLCSFCFCLYFRGKLEPLSWWKPSCQV